LLIDTLKPRSALILSRMDVGSRMSIASSASGRAYLACLPTDQQTSLMNQLFALAAHKSKLKASMKQALTEHAQLGFCSSFGEWHPDIHALGFTLRSPQGELYAVSCGGPAFMLPKEMMVKKLGPKILQTQSAIAKETGTAARDG
jgi:IclR family transcriptional regulator, positive regulator for flagellar biogenesis